MPPRNSLRCPAVPDLRWEVDLRKSYFICRNVNKGSAVIKRNIAGLHVSFISSRTDRSLRKQKKIEEVTAQSHRKTGKGRAGRLGFAYKQVRDQWQKD